MTLSHQFARHILDFYQRELPPEARSRARTAIIDTLGVTLAGSQQAGSRKLRAAVVPAAATGRSRIFGTDLRLNALDAALINGTAAHMLDFDDSNSHLHGHVSVAVLPALLAIADEQESSAEDILQAYVTGFETAARLGDSVGRYQYTHGWHPTTTVGVFAAVAACAALLQLSETQTAAALAIVTTLVSGIKSNFGTETKPLGVGNANRNAVLAIRLAQQGFSAGELAFEHHHGYLNVFNGGADNYDVTPLITPWTGDPMLLDRIKGNKQKPFPCCYAILSPLDGILSLREQHRLTPDQIAGVSVGVHPIRYPHINVPHPENPLAAKFSLHYCIARALIDGTLTLDDFIDETLFAAPPTRALMSRISLYRYDSDNTGGAEVAITTHDGRALTQFVAGARGSTYDNPLPDSLMEEKFLQCAALALGDEGARRLYQRLNQDNFL